MKIAFVGFGEVNTPVEIIERKCGKALEDLKKSGAEVYSIYPVTDDYEEKDVNKAIEYLNGKDFDCLVLCVAGWIPTHAVVKVTEQFRHIPMVLWGLCGWMEDGKFYAYPVEEAQFMLTDSDENIKFTETGFIVERKDLPSIVYEGRIDALKVIKDEYVLEIFVNGGESVYTIVLC